MIQVSKASMKRWLYSTNHKDVGILYTITSLAFFFIGGSLALTMRAQLAAPNSRFLNAADYNTFVSEHGLLMILWVLSPLAIGLANYFIPLQIGARDLAFPRLNAMSYWLYFFGGVAMVMSLILGGPNTGWTLYAPQTACTDPLCAAPGINVAVTGLILLVASITMGSVNFIVTIFKMRAPGLKLKHMSLFPWSILITVFMMLYAFPSLLAGLILLYSDRSFQGRLAYLTFAQGGNVPSLLWDNIFWFFGHPEVYIVLFPAIGVVGEILPTFTRRPLYGAKYIAISIVAAAVLSFIVWGHHMFITGVSPLTTTLFTITTIGVSLPFDVITISLIETLFKAKIRLKAPALFAIGSVALFVIGGITGVFLASIALDHELRGTYFVVAHFHYIMVGAGILALMGGLYYWFPKMVGRMYNEKLAKVHFVLSFISFNILYFPMFLLLEMPRRIFNYTPDTGWAPLNLLATIGGFVFGISQLLIVINLGRSLRTGPPSGPNPWNGWTLEWAVPSPPPLHNFDQIPEITDDGVVHLEGESRHSLSNGVGNGHSVPHSSHTSRWPIVVALGTFLFLLGLTMGNGPPGVLQLVPGVAVGLVGLYGYGKETFIVHEDEKVESWPFGAIPRMRFGVWTFLASEIIFFGVLLSAYMFVRVNSTVWPPLDYFSIQKGAINTFILLTSSLTAVIALASAKSGSRTGLIASLAATFALGAFFLYNKAVEWEELAVGHSLVPSGSIFDNFPLAATSYYITTGVHGVHVFAGLAMIAYLVPRVLKGGYLRQQSETIHYFGLYWHFVDIVWIFLFPLFYLI